MTPNYDHRPEKMLITGASGTGKTTLFLSHAVTSKARFKFVFDHDGQFANRVGWQPARTVQEIGSATQRGICVFDPSQMFPGNLPGAFAFFCDWVWTVSQRFKGRKLLYADEFQKYTFTGPQGLPPEFTTLLETGRHYECDVCLISQSPNLTHTRVRNQLTRVVSFRQVDERAVNFLESLGFDADRLRNLKRFHFIGLDLDAADVNQRWTEGKTKKL
jgi:Cdc6-like AAA superfamily ATPase